MLLSYLNARLFYFHCRASVDIYVDAMEGSDFLTEPEKSNVPASAVTVSGTGVSTAVKEAREANHEVARALDLTAATPEGKAQNNLQKFEEKSMKEQLLIMFSALPKQQQADMLSWQFTSQSDLDDPTGNETRGSSTKTVLINGESGEGKKETAGAKKESIKPFMAYPQRQYLITKEEKPRPGTRLRPHGGIPRI
mgnify:CR=1 FL=1